MTAGTCEDCGTYRPWLHKHHLKPRAEGGTDADGTVLICGNCHARRHGGPRGGTLGPKFSNTPEAKAKRSASLKKSWQSPERHQHQSEKIKAAYREGRKLPTGAATPGRHDPRPEHGEKMRQFWAAHPEKKEAMRQKMREARAAHPWSTKPRSDN